VKKKLLYYAVAVVLVLCTIELISFIFFSVFRDRFGLRDPHKYTVARTDIPKLKRLYDFSLGWKRRFPTPFGERPRRMEYGRPLMAAFGDSFTFCGQVRDADTWEEQLAEMVSADAGLGYLLGYSMVISATDLLFVTILCLGVLGFLTDKVFQLLARVAFGRFT